MQLDQLIALCRRVRKRACWPDRQRGAAVAAVLAIVAMSVPFNVAQAQAPGGLRIPPRGLEQLRPDGSAVGAAHAAPTKVEIVVDTDTGIDDAAALIWLLQQPADPEIDLLGITTVAGNTTVENATNNVIKILDVMGMDDVPVHMGLPKPLSRQLSSIGLPLHGFDGLGNTSMVAASSAELAEARRDAFKFLCEIADAHDDDDDEMLMLVALGPLTNVARAVMHCPGSMRNYDRVVILGGAKYLGGNNTAVAEFNFWQDPEAADLVLRAGLNNVTLVTFDAFSRFGLTLCQAGKLAALDEETAPGPVLLGEALNYYLSVQLAALYGEDLPLDVPLPVPDPPAMMVALQPEWIGDPAEGLVKVVGKPDLVRGQSVIGLWPQERFMMIASEKEIDQVSILFATGNVDAGQALYDTILDREPPNVEAVTLEIDGPSMVNRFLTDLGVDNEPCVVTTAGQGSGYKPAAAYISADRQEGGIRLFFPAMLKP